MAIETTSARDDRRGVIAVAEPELHEAAHVDERRRIRTFDSLRDPGFRWYFCSMVAWFASAQMQLLVRSWLVYDLTGSYAALGLISLANAVPGLVLSLPGGVIADKVTKKRIVQFGQVANMITTAVLAVLMITGLIEFWQLMVSAVVQGTTNAVIMPARQSMIPEIIGKEQLMNAVALNSAAMNFMRIAGIAAGGALLALMGPGGVHVAMSLLFLAGALCLIPVHTRPGNFEQGTSIAQAARTGLSDIREGWRYMRRDKTVFVILATTQVIVLLSMSYQILLAGFAKDVFDAGPGRLTLLYMATGVGALTSSLVIATLPDRKRGLIFLFASLLLGVALLLFSISSWYWVTVGILVFLGMGQAGRQSLGNILLQSYTQDEYRGRVMSIFMLEFSMVPLATFGVGIAANMVGVQVALAVTSAALVAFVIANLVFGRRLRELD